jgi:hypothetical protein
MASFCIGRTYELRYAKRFDEVRIKLLYGSPSAGPLVLTVEQFEKRFVR